MIPFQLQLDINKEEKKEFYLSEEKESPIFNPNVEDKSKSSSSLVDKVKEDLYIGSNSGLGDKGKKEWYKEWFK